MSTPTLEPCPFCKCEMEPHTQHFSHPENECCLSNHGWRNEEIAAWNTRAALDASGNDERLGKVLAKLRDTHRGVLLGDTRKVTASNLNSAIRSLRAIARAQEQSDG